MDSSKAKRKSIKAFTREEPVRRRSPFRKALHISIRSSQAQYEVVTINKTVRRMDMEGRTTDNLAAAAGEVSSKVKVRHVLQKEAPLSNKQKLPDLMDLEKLTQVHKAIKLLFKHLSVPSLRLAGRLKSFLRMADILTQDRQILSIVEGFEIPLSSAMQEKLPVPMKTNLEQTELIDRKGQEML